MTEVLLLPESAIYDFAGIFKVFAYIDKNDHLYIKDTRANIEKCLPDYILSDPFDLERVNAFFSTNATPAIRVRNNGHIHYIVLDEYDTANVEIFSNSGGVKS